MLSKEEISSRLHENFRQAVTPSQYAMWFESVRVVRVTEEKILLETSTNVIKNVLFSKFNNVLYDAVGLILGDRIGIELVSSDDVKADENIRREVNAGASSSNQFNPRYNFDNFIVGDNNKFTHAFCMAVAEMPGQMYNPLFLYGGVGLGKTHLMHAIGNYINEVYPEKKVLYVTSEQFTNDFIKSISGGDEKNAAFRDKYRSLDVLLIDDIQFFCGKNKSQEEFFHTFNALREAGAQIICTSDKSPKEMPNIEERLRSRFNWGLITDIKQPDLETRMAILRRKANDEHITVEDDVFLFIANKIDSNVRELEGALNRVAAWAKLMGKHVDMKVTTEALSDYFQGKTKVVNTELVIAAVCEYFNVRHEDLIGKRRDSDITVPRHIAMYLCRELTDMSLPGIGKAFGNRHHTTVINACDNVRDEIKINKNIRVYVDDLKKKINES